MVKAKEVLLYDKSEIPFELMVERLCQRYHKLPSEILNEEMDWIRLLLEISAIDTQRQQLEERRAKLRQENNARRH